MKNSSKRGLGRELLLLMLPLLAVGAVALFFWWRAATGPQLLSTPTPISKVFPLPDGRVFAIGASAASNRNAPRRIYVWKSVNGPLLVNRLHSVNTYESSVSPDGKLWAYTALSSTTGRAVGTEIRDLRDFSLVCRTSLSVWGTPFPWRGARELKMYNSTLKKNGNYLLDVESGKLKLLAPKKVDAPSVIAAPDGSWRVRYESSKPIEFKLFDARYGNEQKKMFDQSALVFESQTKPPKATQRIAAPNGARSWTSDSRAFLCIAHLGGVMRDDIIRFDAQSGQFSSVRLENKDPNNWYNAEFSSDGRFLVSSNGRGQTWQIFDARSGRLLRDIGRYVEKPDFVGDATPRLSADGKFWLRPTQTGVEVWDLNGLL